MPHADPDRRDGDRRNADRRDGGRGGGAPWRGVAVVWFAGVQAAVGLGAVSPVGSAVRASLGLSLGTVGWATSGMTAVGAALGIPAGRWLGRFASRGVLVAGLVVIAVAAGAGASAVSWPVLLGTRVVEGAGFLTVLVTGPTALARLTSGRVRTAALAVWGTCVPSGLAVATAAGGLLASALRWNRWLGLTGAGPLLAAVLVAVFLPRLPGSPAGARSPGALTRAFAPAGAYACLSLIGVAVTVLLPGFLTGVRHVPDARAGAAVAVVSVASALGGLCAGALLRRGTGVRVLLPAAALMPLACLPAFSPGLPLGAAVGTAAVVLFVDGLLISVVFAAVPSVTRRIAEVDVVNGALAQFGSLGILLGPPLFGLAVGRAGWRAVGAATAVVTVPAVALMMLTVWRSAPDSAADRAGRAPDSGCTDTHEALPGRGSRRPD